MFCDATSTPWKATSNATEIVGRAIEVLPGDYAVKNGIAVHTTAVIEPSAILKGPAIVGPNALVAANAYLRGGVFIDRDCIVGPSCELKSTFMFAGSKIAHLSFVGDSLLGAGVNFEAGAIVANHRNELKDKRILICWRDEIIDTGVEKFGALIGNGARIGANAVIAPGCVLSAGHLVPRLGHIDQHPHADP